MTLRKSALCTVLALAAGSTWVVATPSPALAAPSTCQGKAVTIVATKTVTRGTEGDDVVAMEPGSWNRFDALGGNDTVCLAAGAANIDDRDPMPPIGWLDAGTGDDEVVNLTPAATAGIFTIVVLGIGNDMFQGADVGEEVFAEKWDANNADPDIVDPELVGEQRDVVTGAATVHSSAANDGPNTDRITFGGREAHAVLDGPFAPEGLLDVSAASAATLELRAPGRLEPLPAGEVVIDNRARTVSAGTPVISWSGLITTFLIGTPRGDGNQPVVSFRGTDAAESVTFTDVPAGDVALGGGTDRLSVQSWNTAFVPRSADGGAGRDVASIAASCRSVLEIQVDHFAACDENSGSFEGFRDVVVAGGVPGSTTTLVGTRRSERLVANGHSVVVRGRGGRDEIVVDDSWSAEVSAGAGRDRVAASGDDVVLRGQRGRDRLELLGSAGLEGPTGAQRQRVARGGRGDDVLVGASDGRPDRLLGGAGRDWADGRKGRRDLCYAEATRRCERS